MRVIPLDSNGQCEVCDHDWLHIDESFDHEFGTEQIHIWECQKCGKRTSKNPNPDVEPDLE